MSSYFESDEINLRDNIIKFRKYEFRELIIVSDLIPKEHKPKVRLHVGEGYRFVNATVKNYNLNTVCEEANCPNIHECWNRGTATIMILGDVCTRRCPFCDVSHGKPRAPDINEPRNLAKIINEMKLKYVVITSVDRDDLLDRGASHFVSCIKKIRQECPEIKIEILVPDFRSKIDVALCILAQSPPDVFNHNIETVPGLYRKVRPGSRYFGSLELLKNTKKIDKNIFTKSGLMVGLGENKDEILQVMDDLKSADVDFLTIGQYLQPSVKHHPLDRYYKPEEFEELEIAAKSKGFLLVSSSPLTRSSYHADEDFSKLKKNRIDQANAQSIS